MWRPLLRLRQKTRRLRESGDPAAFIQDTGFPLSCQMSGNDDMEDLALPVDLRYAVTRDQCPFEGLEQWDFDTAALDGIRAAAVKRAPGGRVQR